MELTRYNATSAIETLNKQLNKKINKIIKNFKSQNSYLKPITSNPVKITKIIFVSLALLFLLMI
jgi:hypothetical protein